MGVILPFQRRPKLPADWQRRQAHRRLSLQDIRIMVWVGLILGLLAYHALRIGIPVVREPVARSIIERATLGPSAGSRPSGPILERQEGSPSPVLPGTGEPAGRPGFRIVDGDTFWYGSVKIRIADIDTPEVKGKCAYERALAARATRRMEALLATAPFELEPIPGRDEDRYGRKLRIVTRGGRSLGAVLVAEGMAREWTGRRQPWCP